MHAELEENSSNFNYPGSTIDLLMNIKMTIALDAAKPRVKLVLPTDWNFDESSFYADVLAH